MNRISKKGFAPFKCAQKGSAMKQTSKNKGEKEEKW
jgi:hypothetical protein